MYWKGKGLGEHTVILILMSIDTTSVEKENLAQTKKQTLRKTEDFFFIPPTPPNHTHNKPQTKKQFLTKSKPR